MWLTYFEQFLNKTFPKYLAEKPWNYKDDLCVIGAYGLRQVTGEAKWECPILDNAHYLLKSDGSVANWAPGEHNIDKISFG